MKLLLKAILLQPKHYTLLFVTTIALFLLTCSSQLEMFSLGVVAKSGPDVFVLFGKEKQGALEPATQLSLSDVTEKWQDLTGAPEGILTPQKTHTYLQEHGNLNLVQKLAYFLDAHLQIHTHLSRLVLLLVCVAFFKAAALFANRYFTQLIAIRVSRDLRLKYFEHIQSLPMSFYHDYDIGSLSTRVTCDAGIVAQAINSLLINYIQTPFAVTTTLLACFLISWQLSLLIFVGFPLIVIPIIWMAKKIKKIAKQMQCNQEGFASILIDFLSGIMTVKMFTMEEFSLKKYREQNQKLALLEEKSARYAVAARPILHGVSSVFFAIIILSGLYFFHLDPAELLVFCGLLYVVYEPIKKFAEENSNVFRGIAAAERMYEVLDQTSPIVDEADAIEMKGLKEGITFKNVSFRYRNEWVLRNLSFSIKKGETVALVGPTGAGKSTIVKLLPRLYEIQEGEILIDGIPLTQYTQRSLRDQIAFVPQKPFLFFDTIWENLTFGRPFSESEVRAAARNAHAEEFIIRMPGQYHSKLEEAGNNLSGGQQQRLAIARALMKKEAPILIMDEATSALDAQSENKIKEFLIERQASRSQTQIIIAHRLSTILHADKIIYLEKGEKVAEGPREELLQKCPGFRRMYEILQLNPTASF